MIGDLGAEIRQPSKPYENLAQRALCRAQTNILKAMYPDLDSDTKNANKVPKRDLGGGFELLHPHQEGPRSVDDLHDMVILRYIESQVGSLDVARVIWVDQMEGCVQRWGRLRLPNGQICWSGWKEVANNMTRYARNVKVR